MAARPGVGRALELAHDELQEEQGGFGGLLVRREVVEDAALFLSAKGGIGEDHIDALGGRRFRCIGTLRLLPSDRSAAYSRPCSRRFIWASR